MQPTPTPTSAYEVVHWYNIKVRNERREIVENYSWSGLRWELRLKYDWYFKYRAALLQVKYPRYEVQVVWGNEPATGKTLEQIREQKIRAKKAIITKKQNKLDIFIQEFVQYQYNYRSLFPIEQEADYQKHTASIALAKAKIKKLEEELKSM
jgi:hypothetical protein